MLTDLLTELAEYLDDRADVVDGDGGEPRPNKAMYLLQDVEEALQADTVPVDGLKLRYVLLPYLRRQSDAGWPGVSERDRNELGNMLADLRAEFEVER